MPTTSKSFELLDELCDVVLDGPHHLGPVLGSNGWILKTSDTSSKTADGLVGHDIRSKNLSSGRVTNELVARQRVRILPDNENSRTLTLRESRLGAVGLKMRARVSAASSASCQIGRNCDKVEGSG